MSSHIVGFGTSSVPLEPFALKAVKTFENDRVVVTFWMKDHAIVWVACATVSALDNVMVGGETEIKTVANWTMTLLAGAVFFEKALFLGAVSELLRFESDFAAMFSGGFIYTGWVVKP